MAHSPVYSTQARLEALLGQSMTYALLSRAHSGIPDQGTYDAVLERASNDVDARLRGMYVVPFTPTVDGKIADIVDMKIAELLFKVENPDSVDAKSWASDYDDEIQNIRSGLYQLDATLAPKQSADKRTTGLAFTAGDTFIAGVNADGSPKTNNW